MHGSLSLSCLLLVGVAGAAGGDPRAPRVVVEVEEEVYRYESADNGAGPLWCQGSTCLIRVGDTAYASGLETLRDAQPLNNCRWLLFRRKPAGWERVLADPAGRTREPSPLAVFDDGRFFLSANPTLVTNRETYAGPARPEILQFLAAAPDRPPQRLEPVWENAPEFTEHSYRSFAADGPRRELILFQNIGYTHAEWAFLDREGRWSARGRLAWPWGAGYEKPQPIRVCYPNVALNNRAVHFCGVSDIVEPKAEWRAFKKQLTGRDWDYDFRRLFYVWTPDVTTGRFRDWVEIASREATGGWITPGDLWVAPDGAVHLVWTERAIDERLRARFFPEAKQCHALNHAVVRDGRVASRQTLAQAVEGGDSVQPGRARFHVTPDERLFVLAWFNGHDRAGRPVAENRLLELGRDGKPSPWTTVPLQHPFADFFTATVRGGSPPSWTLDLLGQRAGGGQAIHYARLQLQP